LELKIPVRILALAALVALVACKKPEKEKPVPAPTPPPAQPAAASKTVAPRAGAADLAARLAKFAVVDLRADLVGLTANERKALLHLKRAADAIDRVFRKQAFRGEAALRAEVEKAGGPAAALYAIHCGPWDRLDHFRPFFGDRQRPPGAGFYPEDLSKTELEAVLRRGGPQAKALQSPYTVVERRGSELVAVPYSEVYRGELGEAAGELEAAAALVPAPSLAKFLRSRARALRDNDYFASEVDWMDVAESRLDVTIGPYEVYEDDLMGLKAAFEAVIGVRDEASTRAHALFQQHHAALEKALPIPDKYRSRRAAGSPIVVIQQVYAGGDANKGVRAIAFNLPNDEAVRAQKGSKKVMIKNITEAKFEKILRPIASVLLDAAFVGDVDFETFFNHALMHELAHGMGPGILRRDGGEVTVNQALRELYSAVEEAKADIVGLYSVGVLQDRGLLPRERERFVYPTYLASMLRSIRFGAQEAHGRANVLQLNFLEAEGGITFDEMAGRFGVDRKRMPEAVKKLAVELLTIEGEGDYERAKAFLERWAKPKPSLLSALGRLGGVPVDVLPRYPNL
jgi:hypothetical protein